MNDRGDLIISTESARWIVRDWLALTGGPVDAVVLVGGNALPESFANATLPDSSPCPAKLVIDARIIASREALVDQAERFHRVPRAVPSLLVGLYSLTFLDKQASALNCIDALGDALGALMGEVLLVHAVLPEPARGSLTAVTVAWLSRRWSGVAMEPWV